MNLRVIVFIVAPDHVQAAVVSVEADLFVDPQQQGNLPVPQDFVVPLRRIRVSEVTQIDKGFRAHGEPGDLVAEDDHGAGVLQRPDLQFTLVGVHVQVDILVQPSVVHDVAGLEFSPVPVVRAVVLVRVDSRQLSSKDSSVQAFRVLALGCGRSGQGEQRQSNEYQSFYHKKLLNG